jgi:hypothetical protein
LCENVELRITMGRESRRIAVEKFSCEIVNHAIVALLQSGAE